MRICCKCDGDGPQVAVRIREVMLVVAEQSEQKAPLSSEEWASLLPRWFLETFATSAEYWQDAKTDGRVRVREELWSLDAWIYWLQDPELERSWRWWSCEASPDSVDIKIEATEWPFGWGWFWWLLRASGVREIDELEPCD